MQLRRDCALWAHNGSLQQVNSPQTQYPPHVRNTLYWGQDKGDNLVPKSLPPMVLSHDQFPTAGSR